MAFGSTLRFGGFLFGAVQLIKQSQDDGGGEVVTWKISPVNDRLRMVTSRQMTGMALHPCSNNEVYTGVSLCSCEVYTGVQCTYVCALEPVETQHFLV